MPVAICNKCNTLVPYSNKSGASIKDKACECGSTDLSMVGGHWNDQKSGWDYKDRKGNHRKFVPVIIPALTENNSFKLNTNQHETVTN